MHNKKARTESFWEWLAANGERVRAEIKSNTREIYEEVSDAFHRQYPNLIVEMSYTDREVTLNVTADGRVEKFPRVIKLVQSAPQVPGFKVEAFRPRGRIEGIKLQIADHTLGIDDVWCSAEPTGNQLHLTLWVRGLTEENEKPLRMGAKLLVDHTAGEFDTGTKIASIEYEPLPDNPDDNAILFPLSQLPDRLDELPAVEL